MPDRYVSRRSAVLATCFLASASILQAQNPATLFINPPGLTTPTGYTHVVPAPDGQTVYVAGQVAFDSLGQVVGVGDFRTQLERVYTNLRTALASVGGTLADLTKTTTVAIPLP